MTLIDKKIIVAIDKKIAHLDFFFAKIVSLVEVIYFDDLEELPVKSYQGLFVSSSTKITKTNFPFSSLQFIASPTAGLDHIADFFLTKKNLHLASAKGINRQAVGDYILATILCYAFEKKLEIPQITLGIIGFGAIGSSLGKRANELGIRTIIYDPFIPAYSNPKNLLALKKAQVVTFHVPLTKNGRHATFEMIDGNYFKKILPSSRNAIPLLINTSRGAIFKLKDLKEKIREKRITYAFDVWPDEPYLDNFLLSYAWLATPHIAGYSTKSKWGSSQKVFFDFVNYFKIPYPLKFEDKNKQKILSKKIIEVPALSTKKAEEIPTAIKIVLEEILELNKTTLLLKESGPIRKVSKVKKKKLFFALRKKYLSKKEFSEVVVKVKGKNIAFPTLIKSLLKNYKSFKL